MFGAQILYFTLYFCFIMHLFKHLILISFSWSFIYTVNSWVSAGKSSPLRLIIGWQINPIFKIAHTNVFTSVFYSSLLSKMHIPENVSIWASLQLLIVVFNVLFCTFLITKLECRSTDWHATEMFRETLWHCLFIPTLNKPILPPLWWVQQLNIGSHPSHVILCFSLNQIDWF